MRTADGAADAAARKKKLLLFGGAVVVMALLVVLGVRQVWPEGDAAEPAAAAEDTTAEALTAADVTNQFLTAFAAGDAADAGVLTDDPDTATTTLSAVRHGLAPTAVTAAAAAPPVEKGATADARFTVTWTLGPARVWTYDSALSLVRTDERWLVHWAPAIVHPKLAATQSLAIRDRAGQPAVLDRDGAPLLVWTADGTAPAPGAGAPLLRPGLGRVAGGGQDTHAWYVAVLDAAGTEVGLLDGTKAAAITSTVSTPVQRAAQAAVDAQQLPAMLVAIQPSTGELLAVAQNSAAGPDPVALQGLYPPGSTFKIATAAALLEAGAADIDTVLPCPGSATVGQRTVRNADFELGDVPLRTAFAQSCNTTFAMQAAKLAPQTLADAAGQLGLAADFEVAGITTEAGSVPVPAGTTALVESSIGQGTVQASCFGVTLMSATVAAGRAVTPVLVRGTETGVATGYEAPPSAVVGALRTMMRQVVTDGRGSALARYGAVSGKTGTAQVDDGSNAHGWFTGYRDDIAFTALVLDAGTSAAAVDVTGAFLGGLG